MRTHTILIWVFSDFSQSLDKFVFALIQEPLFVRSLQVFIEIGYLHHRLFKEIVGFLFFNFSWRYKNKYFFWLVFSFLFLSQWPGASIICLHRLRSCFRSFSIPRSFALVIPQPEVSVNSAMECLIDGCLGFRALLTLRRIVDYINLFYIICPLDIKYISIHPSIHIRSHRSSLGRCSRQNTRRLRSQKNQDGSDSQLSGDYVIWLSPKTHVCPPPETLGRLSETDVSK